MHATPSTPFPLLFFFAFFSSSELRLSRQKHRGADVADASCVLIGIGMRLFNQTWLTCLSCWTNPWLGIFASPSPLSQCAWQCALSVPDSVCTECHLTVCLTVCTECHLSTCKWSQLWSKILQNNSTPCHNIAKQWTSPCHPLNLGHDDPTVYFDLHPAVHHKVPNLSLCYIGIIVFCCLHSLLTISTIALYSLYMNTSCRSSSFVP